MNVDCTVNGINQYWGPFERPLTRVENLQIVSYFNLRMRSEEQVPRTRYSVMSIGFRQ